MATPMTISDLEQARTMIAAGDLAGFYSYMADQGYNYALLAGGLVSGKSFSGAAAINYMLSSAQSQGVSFTASQVPTLETEMAKAWVTALEQSAALSDGVVSSDLDYQQTLAFHTIVFKDFDLTAAAWTLTVPGEVLGVKYMETNYASLLNELRDSPTGPLVSETALFLEMSAAVTDSADFSSQQIIAAGGWLRTNALNIGSDLAAIIKDVTPSGHGVELPGGGIQYTNGSGVTLIQYTNVISDVDGVPQYVETENVWDLPVSSPGVSVTELSDGVTVNETASANATISTSGVVAVSGATIAIGAGDLGGGHQVSIDGSNNTLWLQSTGIDATLTGSNNLVNVGNGSAVMLNGGATGLAVAVDGLGNVSIRAGETTDGLSQTIFLGSTVGGSSIAVGGESVFTLGQISGITVDAGNITITTTPQQSGVGEVISIDDGLLSANFTSADGTIAAQWNSQLSGQSTLSQWTQNGTTYTGSDVVASVATGASTNDVQLNATGQAALGSVYGNDLNLIADENTAGLPSDLTALVGMDASLAADVAGLNFLSERIENNNVSDTWIWDFIGPPPGSTFTLSGVAIAGSYDPAALHLLSGISGAVGTSNGNIGDNGVETFPVDTPIIISKPIFPLVLDLDGNGINLIPESQSGATFDINGTGTRQQVGWVGPTNGILVFDQNHNGTIDSTREWFGEDFSVSGSTPPASQTGFQALATLAQAGATTFSEASSRLDPTTGVSYFDELQVWVDANGNGQTDAGELRSLASLGITSIGLQSTEVGQNIGGNEVASTATYTTSDGVTRSVDDIGLATSTSGVTDTFGTSSAGAIAVAEYVSKGYAATAEGQAHAIVAGIQGVSVNFASQIAAIQAWDATTRIKEGSSTILDKNPNPQDIAILGSAPIANATHFQDGYIVYNKAPEHTVEALNDITALAPVTLLSVNAIAVGATAVMSSEVTAEKADLSGASTDADAARADALSANSIWGRAIAGYLNAAAQVDALSQELATVGAEISQLIPINFEAQNNLSNGYSYFSAGDAAFAADTFAGLAAGQQSFAALKDGLDRALSVIAQEGDYQQAYVGKGGTTTTLDGGRDVFLASGGAETLIDGAGQDTILLNPDSVNLSIDGFKVGANGDQLQFLAVGSSISLSDDGRGGTLIHYGSNQTVDLVGVSAGSIDLFDNIVGVSAVSYAGVSQGGLRGTGGARVYDGQVHVTSITASNAGDTLSGDSAATTLVGGIGNDTFDIDGNGYNVNGEAGTNTVSYVNVPLGVTVNLQAGQDNLGSTLFDIQNVHGSALNDSIAGSTGNNVLDGGGGNDSLNGGGGNDTYVFDQGYGQDVIENGVSANGIPSGSLLFGAGITANNLWFTQSGNDLVVQVLGSDSQVTIKGWFTSSWEQLESISLSNGLQVSPQAVDAILGLQAAYVAAHAGFDPQTTQSMPGGIDLSGYFVPLSNPVTVPVATNIALATEHQYEGSYATQGADQASSVAGAISGQAGNVTNAYNNAVQLSNTGKALPPPYGSGENFAYQYTESGSSLTYVTLSTQAWGHFLSGTNISTTPVGVTSYQQIGALQPSVFYLQATTVSTGSSTNPVGKYAFVGDPNVIGNVIGTIGQVTNDISSVRSLAQAIATADTAEQTALGAAVALNASGATLDPLAVGQERQDALNAEADFAQAIAQWMPVMNNLAAAGSLLQSSQAMLNGILPATQVTTQQIQVGGLHGPVTVTITDTTTFGFYTAQDQAQFNALESAQSVAQAALGVANGEFGSLLSALTGFGPYSATEIAGTSANLAAVDAGGDLLIVGGTGHHVLAGGSGRDAFAFGSWNDTGGATIQNFQTGTQGDRMLVVPAQRTVYLTDSGNTTNVSFTVAGGGTDTVALTGVALSSLSLYDNFEGVDTASFTNENHGVTINLESVTPRSFDGETHIRNLIGSNYGDTLIGDEQDNTITGGAGNDTLSGGAGNNVLNGGGGINAVSYAGSAAGVIVNLATGTASNGYGGVDTLSNIQNVIGSAGNDLIEGNSSNNVLDGGKGDDTEVGGGGVDTYVFGAGYGREIIVNGSSTSTGPGGQLELGVGLTTSNLWFSKSGEDLVIQVLGRQDSVTIQDWFLNTASYRQLTNIAWADGTTLSAANVANLVAALATAAPGFNPSTATELPSAAVEAAEQYWTTTINGTSGNDNLVATGTNDRLIGNGGDDSYSFNLTNSQEIIVNGVSTHAGPSGRLALGSGINPNNLWFAKSGNDLTIQVIGTTDVITVQGWFSNGYSQMEGLILADGSMISGTAIGALAAAMDAYQNSNPSFNAKTATQLPNDATLSMALNTEWSRLITGTSGSDSLFGGQGADNLDGGLGNDTLAGGAGAANYVFNANYGKDIIVNGVASNGGPSGTLTFGNGLTQQNLWFVQSGNDLVIQELGTASQVTVKGWFSNSYSQLSSIIAGGVTLGAASVAQLAQAMTSYQTANPGFSVSNASSMPSAVEGAIDVAWPGGKTLTGTVGNDILDPAGQARDTLVGNGGIDTYDFSVADGQETIINGVSTNQVALGRLVLGSGLTPNNLWFTRSGSDLVIQELGAGAAVTIKGWYSNTYSQLGYLALADGSMISNSQINALVIGMAAYRAGNPSFNPSTATQMPNDTSAAASALYSILGTNWGRQIYVQSGDNDGIFWGNDQVYVSSGNQTIIGSRGNNTTYWFGNDLRQITITGQSPASGTQMGGIQLPPGLSPGSLWLTQVGNDLRIQFLGSGSEITYTNWFAGAALAFIGGANATTRLTTAEVNGLAAAMTSYQSTNPQFDPRTATSMPESALIALLRYMPYLELAEENGTVEVGAASNGGVIDSASWNVVEISNSVAPEFFLNRGYGQNVITIDDAVQTGYLMFGAGINAGNLWITRTGNDLLIQLLGTKTQTVVQNWFVPGDTAFQLHGFYFSDLSVVPTAQISALAAAMTAYQGSHPGYNPQVATELPDDSSIIAAVDAGWARTVTGSATFTDEGVGPGNITLVGGSRFEFDVEDGNQTIAPSISVTGLAAGALEIDGALSVNNVWFSQNGENLVIQFIGKSDSVTIENWFQGAAYQLQNITLDGRQITASGVNTLEQTMSAYQSANPSFSPVSSTVMPNDATLQAAVGSNWSGAPVVSGTGGNDSLNGSGKFETLVGNGGADTYLFGRGDGVETIVNGVASSNAAGGALLLGTGIADTSVWFDRVDNSGNVSSAGNNLRLDILGTDDSITIANWFVAGSNFSQLGEIELSDGGLKLDAQVNTLVQAMASFESGFTTVNGGATFDPGNLSNATITNPTLLNAVASAWHH